MNLNGMDAFKSFMVCFRCIRCDLHAILERRCLGSIERLPSCEYTHCVGLLHVTTGLPICSNPVHCPLSHPTRVEFRKSYITDYTRMFLAYTMLA